MLWDVDIESSVCDLHDAIGSFTSLHQETEITLRTGTLTFTTREARTVPPLELVKFHAIEDALRPVSYWPRGPRQKRIVLRDLHHQRLSVLTPIDVSLEIWDDVVTAYSYDLDEFEAAKEEFVALDELRASIADLYYILKSEQERLGPLPQEQWNYLSRIIREV